MATSSPTTATAEDSPGNSEKEPDAGSGQRCTVPSGAGKGPSCATSFPSWYESSQCQKGHCPENLPQGHVAQEPGQGRSCARSLNPAAYSKARLSTGRSHLRPDPQHSPGSPGSARLLRDLEAHRGHLCHVSRGGQAAVAFPNPSH